MSDKSYSTWIKNTVLDPVWWLWILSAVVAAAISVLDLAGVIDSDVAPYNMAFNVSWVVLGLSILACAIRGKDVGEDKPMTTGTRVFTAVLGIFLAVVAVISILG